MDKPFFFPISFPVLVNRLRFWQLDKLGYRGGGEGILAGSPFLRGSTFIL